MVFDRSGSTAHATQKLTPRLTLSLPVTPWTTPRLTRTHGLLHFATQPPRLDDFSGHTETLGRTLDLT
eukprot:51290-Rhodomonas_salina.1